MTRVMETEVVERPRYPHLVLTAREAGIVALIAVGSSNKEVARALHLSPLTVKAHLQRVASRYGTGDRTRIVTLAIAAGEIDLPAVEAA